MSTGETQTSQTDVNNVNNVNNVSDVNHNILNFSINQLLDTVQQDRERNSSLSQNYFSRFDKSTEETMLRYINEHQMFDNYSQFIRVGMIYFTTALVQLGIDSDNLNLQMEIQQLQKRAAYLTELKKQQELKKQSSQALSGPEKFGIPAVPRPGENND